MASSLWNACELNWWYNQSCSMSSYLETFTSLCVSRWKTFEQRLMRPKKINVLTKCNDAEKLSWCWCWRNSESSWWMVVESKDIGESFCKDKCFIRCLVNCGHRKGDFAFTQCFSKLYARELWSRRGGYCHSPAILSIGQVFDDISERFWRGQFLAGQVQAVSKYL